MRRFLTLLIISLLLIGLDFLGWESPLRLVAERIFNPGQKKIFQLVTNIRWQTANWRSSPRQLTELRVKIAELERENAALQIENSKLKIDNQSMRQLLGAPLPPDWQFLPAQVLGKARYLLIDQGKQNKVEEGMVAVFENVLVGRVSKVNPKTSLIILPGDPDLSIKVKTKTARGVLVGNGEQLLIDQVLQRETLLPGSVVVTSGEEEIFPANLIIGKIKEVQKEERQPYQKAVVEPLVNYTGLERVFLLKP